MFPCNYKCLGSIFLLSFAVASCGESDAIQLPPSQENKNESTEISRPTENLVTPLGVKGEVIDIAGRWIVGKGEVYVSNRFFYYFGDLQVSSVPTKAQNKLNRVTIVYWSNDDAEMVVQTGDILKRRFERIFWARDSNYNYRFCHDEGFNSLSEAKAAKKPDKKNLESGCGNKKEAWGTALNALDISGRWKNDNGGEYNFLGRTFVDDTVKSTTIESHKKNIDAFSNQQHAFVILKDSPNSTYVKYFWKVIDENNIKLCQFINKGNSSFDLMGQTARPQDDDNSCIGGWISLHRFFEFSGKWKKDDNSSLVVTETKFDSKDIIYKNDRLGLFVTKVHNNFDRYSLIFFKRTNIGNAYYCTVNENMPDIYSALNTNLENLGFFKEGCLGKPWTHLRSETSVPFNGYWFNNDNHLSSNILNTYEGNAITSFNDKFFMTINDVDHLLFQKYYLYAYEIDPSNGDLHICKVLETYQPDIKYNTNDKDFNQNVSLDRSDLVTGCLNKKWLSLTKTYQGLGVFNVNNDKYYKFSTTDIVVEDDTSQKVTYNISEFFDSNKIIAEYNGRFFTFVIKSSDVSSTIAHLCAPPQDFDTVDEAKEFITKEIDLSNDLAGCNGDVWQTMEGFPIANTLWRVGENPFIIGFDRMNDRGIEVLNNTAHWLITKDFPQGSDSVEYQLIYWSARTNEGKLKVVYYCRSGNKSNNLQNLIESANNQNVDASNIEEGCNGNAWTKLVAESF